MVHRNGRGSRNGDHCSNSIAMSWNGCDRSTYFFIKVLKNYQKIVQNAKKYMKISINAHSNFSIILSTITYKIDKLYWDKTIDNQL